MTNNLEKIEIVLTNFTTGKVTVVETIRGSEEWKHLLCVAIPQQLALRAEQKKSHRHFDKSDMEDYLTEKAYDILLKYDEEKNPNFEAFLKFCLARKVYSFFDDKGVERSTDYYAQKDTASDNGDAIIFEPSSNINEWETVDSSVAFGELLQSLTWAERQIIDYTQKGFSGAEIADKMGVSRMTIYRQLKKLAKLPELKAILSELIESKYQGQEAPFEPVSTEEEYYSEKRVAQRKRKAKRKADLNIETTTTEETFQRVKAYKALVKELNANNIDLYFTAKKWLGDILHKEEGEVDEGAK